MLFLASPFIAAKSTFDILRKDGTICAIKKDMPFTGRKNGAFSEELDLNEIKAYTKQRGVTLNDYMICVLSTTLYEYFDRRKEEWDDVIPRSINIGMPISLRPPAKDLKDVRMVNDFVSYPITLPIRKNLEDVLP